MDLKTSAGCIGSRALALVVIWGKEFSEEFAKGCFQVALDVLRRLALVGHADIILIRT